MNTLLNDTKAIILPIHVYDEYILELPPPDGFEYTGQLSPPQRGDWFLNLKGVPECSPLNMQGLAANLRLILRKQPRKQIILTEIRRNSQPHRGEYYTVAGGKGAIFSWDSSEPRVQMSLSDTCTIFKREEREI